MTNITMLTDKIGRALEVKDLTIVDQFDLLEAAQQQARYEHWFSLASMVFSCLSIDGVPLPKPRKPEDFKKNIAILKDEGMDEILKHFVQENKQTSYDETVEAEKNS